MDQGNTASGSTQVVAIDEPWDAEHVLEVKVRAQHCNLPTSYGVVDTSSFAVGIASGTSEASVDSRSCYHAFSIAKTFGVSQNYHFL